MAQFCVPSQHCSTTQRIASGLDLITRLMYDRLLAVHGFFDLFARFHAFFHARTKFYPTVETTKNRVERNVEPIMQHYLEQSGAVIRAVSSTPEGLNAAEAQKRLAENGPNKLAEGKKTPLIARFFEQMKDPMILILLVAAVISGVTAAIEGESFADVIIILTVVIINAVLGVVQESKAEKAIEALQQMSAATCRVLRDGDMTRIKTEDLVVGDVVLLEAGDAVPADARVLESASMQIEEAALTGESVPRKQA